MPDDLQFSGQVFDLLADCVRQNRPHLLRAGLHRRDEDCQPFLADEVCLRCGRDHQHACSGCGGRAFHRATCVDLADADTGGTR